MCNLQLQNTVKSGAYLGGGGGVCPDLYQKFEKSALIAVIYVGKITQLK